MFDIFATILSAGVVISVVTLVVHEPLLLAAGISTLLGLMFVLLPAFVSMVPVLGYLLIFIGVVLLSYGVMSTRSWLNALEARRVAALARRRTLYAARTRPDDDSELRRAGRMASLAAPASGDGGKPANDGGAEGVRADPTPIGGASTAGGQPGRGTASADALTGGALGRIGRSLAHSAGGGRPSAGRERREDDRETDTDDRDRRPVPSSTSARPGIPTATPVAKAPVPAPAQVSTPTPAPASVSPPVPTATATATAPSPAAPAKPKSRGAERMDRIKAEAREATSARRRRPVTVAGGAPSSQSPAVSDGVPSPQSMPVPEPVPVSDPGAAEKAAVADRRKRRERDLAELGLVGLDQAELDRALRAEPPAEKAGAKPFLGRLARRA
jgi:hypothetical protein